MRHIHEYPTLGKGQVPEQCENSKTDNEGFFFISMSVITRSTGRKNAHSLKADRQYIWHGG